MTRYYDTLDSGSDDFHLRRHPRHSVEIKLYHYPNNDVADLASLVEQLRSADTRLRVFGSETHKYRPGSTLSETEQQAFELANRITLPADYRAFLAHVGNGGAGPAYGLTPLDPCAIDCGLSRPFLAIKATDQLTEDELERLMFLDEYPGILEVCHHGSGIVSFLVVNGPTYGTIWGGLEDFYPTDASFHDWYHSWADRALRCLKNERLKAELRVGMWKSDVLAEIPSDWKERQITWPTGTQWLFESSDIPVQLELDDLGRVIKLNPWHHI